MTENTNSKPIMSSSPDRNSFQKLNYVKRKEELGEEPNQEYLDFFEALRVRRENDMRDPKWQIDNLEYDLRTTDWILDKVRNSDTYAQNLYAALCNNDFVRNDVWPILSGKIYSCSWRYAGGIIADMREKGDYIDWYCSGIGDGLGNGDITGDKNYVGESVVTDEIKSDLLKLGWIIAKDNNDEQL